MFKKGDIVMRINCDFTNPWTTFKVGDLGKIMEIKTSVQIVVMPINSKIEATLLAENLTLSREGVFLINLKQIQDAK